MVYQNGPFGRCYVKRFNVTSIIRDKDYDLTQGVKGTSVLYFSANPNGEAEKITVYLKAKPKIKKLSFEFDFADVNIKGKTAHGNILSNNPVRRIGRKSDGISTLSARKVWYDDAIKKINSDERGIFIGEFEAEDKILSITQSGFYRISSLDFNLHFEDDTIVVEKYNPRKPITIIYWDTKSKAYYCKRFIPEPLTSKVPFLEEKVNVLKLCMVDFLPVVSIDGERKEITELTDINKYKAKGKKISDDSKVKIKVLEPLPYEDIIPEEEDKEEQEESRKDFFNDDDNDTPPEDGIQGSLF
jgi:topoisomerase-4 subunit A